MVRKLIILGIDGMDWDVIVRYKDKLPNLYGLMQKNNYPHLRSVFPADTTPAWSTIYTGLDPSEHGIINFVNVGAKENTLDRKAHKVPAAFVAIIFLLTVSDILNGLIIASIMQHVMFLVIIYIAYNYVLISENDDDLLKNIEVSTIATTIGYGLVFLVAYWFYSRGIGFGGIYTTDRYSAGMFLNFISTGGQTTVRLRGFCIDPNSVVTTLIPGASFGFSQPGKDLPTNVDQLIQPLPQVLHVGGVDPTIFIGGFGILVQVVAAHLQEIRHAPQLRQVKVQAVAIQSHLTDIGTQAADAHAQHLFINAVLFGFSGSQDNDLIPFFPHRASPSLS